MNCERTIVKANPFVADFESLISSGPFPLRFPENTGLDQDEEWCLAYIDADWKKIRFHDYHEIYKVPGLYETIFYRTLRCHSPFIVANCLSHALAENKVNAADLRVIDFGAGNGMMGEALQNIGVRHVFGVDILPEARMATERDRPWVYSDFLAADFTNLTDEQTQLLKAFQANALTIVAALGFNDIPPEAFLNALQFVALNGWVTFNIKENFLRSSPTSAFAELIQELIESEVLQMHSYKRCRHRLNIRGEPIFYATIVAQKRKSMPR